MVDGSAANKHKLISRRNQASNSCQEHLQASRPRNEEVFGRVDLGQRKSPADHASRGIAPAPENATRSVCYGIEISQSSRQSMLTAAIPNCLDRVRHQIREWIRAGEDLVKLNVRQDLKRNIDVHAEGTCSWILHDVGFQRWIQAKQSTVAWYTAPPGFGKTILGPASGCPARSRMDPAAVAEWRPAARRGCWSSGPPCPARSSAASAGSRAARVPPPSASEKPSSASARWRGQGCSPPTVAAERPDRAPPPVHLGPRGAGAVQGDQERARRHRQRRRTRVGCRGARHLPTRPGRTDRRRRAAAR